MVDKRQEEIEPIEMLMGEDVLLAIIVLSHDDLFGPEEGSKVSVEVLFLLVADRIVADP